LSPFSYLLHEFRLSFGVRQSELAQRMGYEQTYISALEVGNKGPPTAEFVEKLITTLALGTEEQARLAQAVEASQRKLVLEIDSSPETYWMLKELRERIQFLHPAQIKMIRDVLQLPETLKERAIEPVHRLKRRRSEEARM
jgi:predicted transcriptional regulator